MSDTSILGRQLSPQAHMLTPVLCCPPPNPSLEDGYDVHEDPESHDTSRGIGKGPSGPPQEVAF